MTIGVMALSLCLAASASSPVGLSRAHLLALNEVPLFGPKELHPVESAAPVEATTRVNVTADEAPFTPGTSLLAAGGASAAGAAMMIASTVRLVNTNGLQLPTNLTMLLGGFTLLNFGPNISDALMGDPMFLARRGLLRIGLLLASATMIVLGPLGALATFAGMIAWVGWVLADTLDALHAPERWAARQNGPPGKSATDPSGLLFRF